MTEKEKTIDKENMNKKDSHADHSGHEGHDHKHDHSHDSKANETTQKKEVKISKVKKDVAIVNAPGVHISKRHGMYICSFIKGKSVDDAINQLGEVIMLKRAVPFKGEIPHRKGKIMSGRYPVAASKIFVSVLKNLKGAIIDNQMDITKTRIFSAYTNFASRPQRRGGTKGKRASVTIEAREVKK